MNSQDVKLYYKAMTPLTREDQFNSTPGKVVVFLATIQDQVISLGLSDITTIPDSNAMN